MYHIRIVVRLRFEWINKLKWDWRQLFSEMVPCLDASESAIFGKIDLT